MDEKNTIPDLRLGELTMELQGAQQNTGGASAKVPVKKSQRIGTASVLHKVLFFRLKLLKMFEFH